MSLLNTPSFVFHMSIPFLPLPLTKITSLRLLFKSCSWWNQLFERQSVLSCEVVKGIKIVSEVSRENIKKRLKFVSLSIIQISTPPPKKKKRKRKAASCIQKWVFLAWCHLDEAVIVPWGWLPGSLHGNITPNIQDHHYTCPSRSTHVSILLDSWGRFMDQDQLLFFLFKIYLIGS